MGKRTMRKLLLLLVLPLLTSVTVLAQKGVVSGVVTDAGDNSTLPGVTVLVKGTSTGTVTDINGKYSIEVNPGDTLEFSYMGYATQKVKVNPGTTVNISLSQSALMMDEFVVIGYGVSKKSDATGSVSVIKSKDFNHGAISSPNDLIVGKIAGVQVTSSDGAPGSGAVIRIRGGSSLSASNDPLVVIDGIPVSNNGIAGARNPLNSINPNDIESFTVLKDASATAIYGSRASNGVIIITTKKGKANAPLSVDYNGTFSFNTLPNKVDVLNGDEYRRIINEKYAGQDNVLSLLGKYNTDWQDQIYQTAFGQDHHLRITGGIKGLPYTFSAGYTNQDGLLITDNMKRNTIGASLTPSFFDDHLTFNINVKGAFTKNRFADRGAIGAAVQFDPTKPVYSDSTYTVYFENDNGDIDSVQTDYGGYYTWTQASNGAPIPLATKNPVSLLRSRDDESDVNRILTDMKVDYKFHFLPELKATLNWGYDVSEGSGTVIVPGYAAFEPKYGGGTNNYYKQRNVNELIDFYLDYNKYLDGIKSQINVMGGYSWQHFWSSNYSEQANYRKNHNIKSRSDKTEYYLVSFFGRLNYMFNDKYLFTFTLRDDGTSRFSPETRWGLFPSVALAWKINQENFLKDSKIISQLKLRLGYGVTGQQNIGLGDYPYIPKYVLSDVWAQYQLGNTFYYTLRPDGYDWNIKWEETTTWNAGFDFGFNKDKYYGTLDFYYKQTNDLLNYIPVPAGTNLTNYILTNIGNLENKGVEFTFNARAIATKETVWTIGFNATYNKNKITKLTASDDPEYLGVPTGGISGAVGNNIQMHSVGYAANSFFVFEQVYDENGKPIEGLYVDRNGDGQITDDDKYHYKDPAAKFFFGINSNFQYKDFSFFFSGRANFGNYIYNNVSSDNGWYGKLYRPEGPYLSNVTSDVSEAGFENAQYFSDYYIQNGSFFRMDNIGISYNFKNLIEQNDKFGITLSFTVNNAFVITGYKGLDPEIFQGIDNNLYPRPRTYVIGLNMNF